MINMAEKKGNKQFTKLFEIAKAINLYKTHRVVIRMSIILLPSDDNQQTWLGYHLEILYEIYTLKE